MSFLTDANSYSHLASHFIHNRELNSFTKQKRKYLYIEGLIRFLELYGQNEIGNVEVDIQKIALWVNSPNFENVDLYQITSIEKVFKMLEKDLLNNVPLFRFLKLPEYQRRLFEKDHHERLLEDYKEDCKKYPCLGCVWYHTTLTSFGTIQDCKLPREEITGKWHSNRGRFDITTRTSRNCKYCTSPAQAEEFMKENIKEDSFDFHHIQRKLNSCCEEYNQKINTLENSYIPPYIPEEDKVSLAVTEKEDDLIRDIGRAFNNKQSYSDIRIKLQKAIFLECMIKFIETYAQIEMGSDYIADISKIAKWVDKNQITFKFQSREEIYFYFEEQLCKNESINSFIKIKKT